MWLEIQDKDHVKVNEMKGSGVLPIFIAQLNAVAIKDKKTKMKILYGYKETGSYEFKLYDGIHYIFHDVPFNMGILDTHKIVE